MEESARLRCAAAADKATPSSSASSPSKPPPLLTGTFARLMLANFGYFLSLGTLNPVLPRFINGPLHASDIGVGVGVGSFTITALLLRPWSGRWGDRRGRQGPMLAGASIHAVSVAGLLLANSLTDVIVLRLITGVGEALFFVGAAAAAQDMAPDDRRGEAASLFSLSLFVAMAIGPVVGESLLDAGGFRAAWLFAAGAAVFGALMCLTIPDTRTEAAPDQPGPLVHMAAVRPGAILGCAIWGLAAFSAFVPLYALKLGLPGARLVFLVNAVTILAFRSFGRRIPDRFGPLPTARFSLLCTPAGLAVMALWQDVPGLFVGAVLLAVGQALAFPALMTIAVNNAPATERGAVMGTFTGFFDLSFGLGTAALGAVAHATGYNGAFMTAAGVASLGFVMLVLAPPKVRTPRTPSSVFEIEPPGG